jgi:phosphoglycolate phosphatase
MDKYRHIIWDWNGTLWDDTWLCVEINNHMLQRRSLPEISVDTYRDTLCFPVVDYYCQLGFDYESDPYDRLAEEFIAEYEHRRFECALQEGARELIQTLHSRNIPQAVLSAYQHDTLLQAVDYFGLTPFFNDIIGLDDIYAAGKVENGKQYITGLDLASSEVLFIGDTIHDFEVARAMGVDCVLLAIGHNSRSRLETCGVPVFDSLHDVRNHVTETIG